MKISDIKTVDVGYVWKDDERSTVHYATIAVTTKEQLYYINDQIENDDEEWLFFDERIFYYLCTDNGESIEDMKNPDASYEFYLAEEVE
jgi:hypothetical protein